MQQIVQQKVEYVQISHKLHKIVKEIPDRYYCLLKIIKIKYITVILL